MTDHYAVIGNPISHSKSPLIHTEFAKQTGQNLDYIAQQIALDDLAAGLQRLQQQGFKGINITVPFKEQAWQMVADKSGHAQRAGAINTILFNDNGSLTGDNTDGIGLCRDLLNNHQIELKAKRILLLGAGGAARGVIEPLLQSQPSLLFVANRTASKAHDLCSLFADFGPISGGGYDALSGSFDIIINATAASLSGEVPPITPTILNKNSVCYDMMYSDTDTAFITWAKQYGAAKAVDGLGMLVEQAAEAFRLWRGITPETDKLIMQIRQTNKS
jgi:shikimate dehydrogenase